MSENYDGLNGTEIRMSWTPLRWMTDTITREHGFDCRPIDIPTLIRTISKWTLGGLLGKSDSIVSLLDGVNAQLCLVDDPKMTLELDFKGTLTISRTFNISTSSDALNSTCYNYQVYIYILKYAEWA